MYWPIRLPLQNISVYMFLLALKYKLTMNVCEYIMFLMNRDF